MLAQSSLAALIGSVLWAASIAAWPSWTPVRPAEPSRSLELLRLREHCDSEVAALKDEVANLQQDTATLRKGIVDLANERGTEAWSVYVSTCGAWVVASYLLGGVSFAPYLLRWFGNFTGGTRATAEVHIEDHRESARPATGVASVPDGSSRRPSDSSTSSSGPLGSTVAHRTPTETGLVAYRAPSEVGDTDSQSSGNRFYVPRRLR